MNYEAQTIPEYAEQIAEWLEELASEPGQVDLRYVAEHIRQDIAGLEQDQDERERAIDTYECMNCGITRTYGTEAWVSCEDELGRSCRPRYPLPGGHMELVGYAYKDDFGNWWFADGKAADEVAVYRRVYP